MRCIPVVVLVSLLASQCSSQQEEQPQIIERPGLGRGVQIGALYDARIETFSGFYLWPRDIIQKHVVETAIRRAEFQFTFDDSIQAKYKLLDIYGHVKIEVTGATGVTIEGSARYIGENKDTMLQTKIGLVYKMRTVHQTLDAFHPEMREATYVDILNKKLATHVVTGISWGADCIASFTSLLTSEFDRMDIEAELHLTVKTATVSVQVDAKGKYIDTSDSNYTNVDLRLFGDVLPPQDDVLPISPSEGLVFMRRLHTIGLQGNGVPMKLILTPVKWLESSADAVIFAISESLVNRAMTIFQELQNNEAKIKDASKVPSIGFLAWRWSLLNYMDDFTSYSMEFSANLIQVLRTLRITGDAVPMAQQFAAYYQSQWSSNTIEQELETRRDNIMNLKAEVAAIQRFQVEMAEHYYQYSAPSLDRKYDKVYSLLLTGIVPDHDPARVETIGRFGNLASARLRKNPDSDIIHCVEVSGDNNAKTCTENLKFVVIHYDSFCAHFCDPIYCVESPPACPNASNPDDYVFPKPCWCAAPKTTAVMFQNSLAGVVAPLPLMPPIPEILTVSGDRGYGNIEASPYAQKVKLTLVQAPTGGATILNYVVRVVWYEASVAGATLTWLRRQRQFETRGPDHNIIVSNLTSGEQYKFQVASKTDVGISTFSAEWPLEDFVLISTNTVLLYKLGDYSAPITEMPNWGTVNLTVEVSKVLMDPIGSIRLYANGMQVECVIIAQQTSAKRANCTLQANTLLMDSTIARVMVYGASDDITLNSYAAQTVGDIVLLAPNLASCAKWTHTGSLFCNLRKAERVSCVTSCSSCFIQVNSTLSYLTTNVSGVCVPDAQFNNNFQCLPLLTSAWYKATEENTAGFSILRSGVIVKVQAEWISGAISQRQWIFRSGVGWRQASCTNSSGWPLYSVNCLQVSPAVFQLKAITAAIGEVNMVVQANPTIFAPECTVPSSPTDILSCRLRTPLFLNSKSDTLVPRLVGITYDGQVSFNLAGCGFFF